MPKLERTGLDRSTIIRWLDKCLALKPGEELYIPCDNANHRKLIMANFHAEIKAMSKIDPTSASVIFAKESYKDSRFWIILERKKPLSKVAFKKDENGHLVREELTSLTFERRRIIDLMLKDGHNIKFIKALIGNLKKSEIEYIKRKQK